MIPNMYLLGTHHLSQETKWSKYFEKWNAYTYVCLIFQNVLWVFKLCNLLLNALGKSKVAFMNWMIFDEILHEQTTPNYEH
jgi:hypothetical protein